MCLDWCNPAGQDRKMDKRPYPDLEDVLDAAWDWWREAGVDCAFSDEPSNWLTPPGPEAPHSARAPSGQSGGDAPASAAPVPPAPIAPDTLPESLEAFREWWMLEPTLDGGRTGDRVPPRGIQGAPLMVLVPEPEREDRDRLMSGPQGKLLDSILTAMDLEADAVYLASVLPRHTPMADWTALAASGMDRILAHHVGLVKPGRLIAFGGNILPLLGNDPTHKAGALREFNHGEQRIPLLVARSLPVLLERPRWKANLWQAWLDWTA